MEVAQSKFQRQLVSVCAQSGHHADGKVRKIRVMAEGFARVNVGKVDFDERDGGGGQCVAQRDAGMGVTRRIDENEVNLIARGLVHAINQGAFMIVLKGFDQRPGSAPAVDQSAVDVGERDEAIVRGLTTTQQIQVGSVQNQNMRVQTGDRFDRNAAGSFSRHGRNFAVNGG